MSTFAKIQPSGYIKKSLTQIKKSLTQMKKINENALKTDEKHYFCR